MSNNRDGGFVLYPRRYFVDKENSKQSYVQGVDSKNRPCTVFLHAQESNNVGSHGAVLPDFSKFSERHFGAQMPCHSSPTNCEQSPAGILLIERAGIINQEKRVYYGEWASVLRATAECVRPAIGYGCLEMHFHSKIDYEVQSLYEKYSHLLKQWNATLPEHRGQGLYDQLIEMCVQIWIKRKKWFIGVIVQYEHAVTLDIVNIHSLRNVVLPILETNTRRGCYGGVIFRLRTSEGVVISTYSSYLNMMYDYANGRCPAVEDVFSNFMRYSGEKLLSGYAMFKGAKLDVIPTVRVNCGKMGNARYQEELERYLLVHQTPKILKAYVESMYHWDPLVDFARAKAFLASKFAMRIAQIHQGNGTGNLLVSSAHSFSPQIGNVFELGLENGNVSKIYTMDYKVGRSKFDHTSKTV